MIDFLQSDGDRMPSLQVSEDNLTRSQSSFRLKIRGHFLARK